MRKQFFHRLIALSGALLTLVAAFFMVVGPWLTSDSQSSLTRWATFGYPLFLALSAVLGLVRFWLGLLAAAISGACLIVVYTSYRSPDGPVGLIAPIESFHALPAAVQVAIITPAVIQIALCGLATALEWRHSTGSSEQPDALATRSRDA